MTQDRIIAAIQRAADRLFEIIPSRFTKEMLDDYGITSPEKRLQEINLEVLAVTMFWIHCALRVSLPEEIRQVISQSLWDKICESWESNFSLKGHKVEEFFQILKQRESVWEGIKQRGGEPIDVLQFVAEDLENQGVIESQNQPNLLALLIDFVPVEDIGEICAETEAEFR